MPYKLKKTGSGYKVSNKDSGKTYSKKPLSKKRAASQMRAIYANTNESFHKTLDTILETMADNDKQAMSDLHEEIGQLIQAGGMKAIGCDLKSTTETEWDPMGSERINSVGQRPPQQRVEDVSGAITFELSPPLAALMQRWFATQREIPEDAINLANEIAAGELDSIKITSWYPTLRGTKFFLEPEDYDGI